MISPDSKLSFGKYKGKKLKDCPITYLRWLGENLIDSNFHEYAYVAKDLADEYSKDDKHVGDLEEAADDFLRSKGIDPKNL